MDFQSWIGESTPLQKRIITTDQIVLFAQGFPEEFRPDARSIPLTFPMIWWQQVHLPWMDLPGRIMIHGQQSFTYERKLKYDAELFYRIELANVRETTGSLGNIHLLDCTMTVTDVLKQPVLVANTTLILLEPPAVQPLFSELEPVYPQYPSEIYYQWDGKHRPSPGEPLFNASLGTVTSPMLVAYAAASSDNNAIHLDVLKAHEAGAPRRIAQGMLIGGMIGNRLQVLALDNWILCDIRYRFRSPVMEGDVVRVLVSVINTDNLSHLECSITVYVEHRAGVPSDLLAYEGSVRYIAR
ncbi:MaoC/PaaZ C-terminal domain-containing protein [Paenibacillus sp. PCH8]|uniref:MaoC family dehydratase n=1 Tax=Paenibacillus sp. PCH8 TaxID=2066524 RepID=UPI0015E33A33|nr:MaoC/PaaZ C-terminal domain-containing protein [Paenibacillus sp. PCH8]